MKCWTLLLIFLILLLSQNIAQTNPRVFVFTDINIDAGDPDDRQSLVHLLWYANELEIEGVVPERWNAQGYEACKLAVNAYREDFTTYQLNSKGYPSPDIIMQRIANNAEHAKELFQKAASNKETPLYVLIWGNMEGIARSLLEAPHLADNIRLITIGTGLMLESNIPHIPDHWEKSAPCQQLNWNGAGRNLIYQDPRFNTLWWLEINWTYEGMFSGNEPSEMLNKLTVYGNLGKHLKEVVKNEAWAQYFRVGDTPSVLYVIDTEHPIEDPTQSSWAGRFFQPFAQTKPNYYTDIHEDIEWNYENPCSTWENHVKVRNIAVKTLEAERQDMYLALLKKLDSVYN